MLHPGLYEQVINNALTSELAEIPEARKSVALIDKAEASKVLAQYLTDIVQKGLDNVLDNGGDISAQIELTNQIVTLIQNTTKEADFAALGVDRRAEQLLALLRATDPRLAVGKTAADIERPETSIAQSSLFTGAVHEPQMFAELKKEIVSADRIDMLVSFIKWSGLRLIMDELREFTHSDGELRIITTSYMGATDVKAIEELRKLPNTHIKVSYNTKTTRLHAKAYIFYRETGFTTAYVGSSNLSNAALTSGLEWNTKVTKRDLPETIDKIAATFEYYWNDREFEYYAEDQRERLARALKAEKYFDTNNADVYTMDINPYSYQQEILDKLEAERTVRGYTRNLVVAATGTGKTVISALDYKRFRKQNSDKPCRLLFVAHREEILKQSLYTFRAVLKDANFGELFVGNYKPESIDNLFLSIQTFNSQSFTEKTSPDFYDYIIVDEFHHAAAPTYQKLLAYYQPRILLGLTATPERMDGKSILPYFNNRIAAEIRLPEAIDRKLLCPFQYFGVTDTVDLDALKWSAGGYQKSELEHIYTFSGAVADRRADHVVTSLLKYVTDIDDVKGLGFCVTVDHAEFMCRYFNEHNIPSMFLTGQSPDEERAAAKQRLVSGEVRFIFVVDIYNEGVDIPEVNTVLFLRPTESLTIFLQQLGRGLRLAEDKECLTVLDFIGQANRKYNFEDKFAALLSNATRSVSREIKDGFVSVPKGCYIQLEKKAAKYVLDNIRASYGNTAGLVSRVASFTEDSGLELTLKNFLDYYHLDPRAIYKFSSFSRICARADVIEDFSEPLEDILTKAFAKLAVVDSRRWISFLLDILPRLDNVDFATLSDVEKRMIQMFYITVWGKAVEDWNSEEVQDNLYALSDNSMDLIDRLLTQDNDKKTAIQKSISDADKALEIVNANLGKIEAKEQTQKALDQAQKNLIGENETNLALKAAFDIEKGKVSEREQLAEEKAKIEAEFSRYEALDALEKQIKNDEDTISKNERQLKKDREQYAIDEAEFKILKKEFESLSDAGEGKEKLSRQKEKTQEKQAKLQNISALFKAFHELGDNLDTLQSDYKKASESSEEATADYEAKNRAFLDEQAGIIAETLENGKPCPVCGSLEHPCIAHKSAKAPTEAQLKRAKENADQARKTAEGLSGECKKAKGLLDAKKAETANLVKELWQGVPIEEAEIKLPEEQNVVSAEITALDTALSEEEKKVSRRSALSESLPKTEMSLAERDKDITARSTALEADRASLSEKKNQRNAAKESLRFDNIAEAQRKTEALGKTVSEMKEAYDNAQSALSDSDKKIAGYNASITELSKQLSSDCDLDKEAETKKKTELSEKRAADDDAAKALHTRIESNTKVLANIRAKVGDLDTLEKRYTWLKALSNTANGNISGKEKVMLETYIQMTYFDRIIARANTRFMVMSGGQYELKRRREAENNRSQSGLDLDVIDHYNSTERSVKTLSGGESFKASLSLALGLSDEIQASAGGVKLDTMFVDEGFGSLDEESLDQAMKALSSLADGNRLVGIISHVADLKNRIDKQIVVEKEKSGGSKACIVL